MSVSRRSVLEGLSGVLATAIWPLPAQAAVDDVERQALIAHVRAAFVGFDLLVLARRALRDTGLDRWIPDVETLFADREHLRGFRSLHELGKDPTFEAAMSALMAKMGSHLGTKLVIRRLAKRAPQTPEAREALLATLITGWFGMDLPRLRTHTASYPEGMLVVYGPPTNLSETLASAAREPFHRYLELVHGYRAREWMAYVDERKTLLAALVDPAVRVVVFVGHGSWTGFSLSGFSAPPMTILADVCRNVKEDPKKFVPAVLANNASRGAGARYNQGFLEERELAALIAQLHPGSEGHLPQPKERVVRYTCGSARYQAEGRLLWEMLPDELAAKISVSGAALSAKWPEDEGQWEAPLEAWLADKSVLLEDQPALGTCLVASAEDTRGYAGNSWLPDFVEDPSPAYLPPWPWRAGPAVVVGTALP